MSQSAAQIFGDGWGNYAIRGIVELELPEPLTLWPQTIGWKILLVALLFFVALKIYRAVKKYWANRYRRAAIEKLYAIKQQCDSGNSQALRDLPELLKATALQAYPRQQVASLSGAEWEQFLDGSYKGPSFVEQYSGRLYALSYQPLDSTDNELDDAFWAQLQLWIKSHRGAQSQ